MRKTVLLLTSVALAVLLACGVAMAALPSETPDDTPMLNGPVRAMAEVGGNLWVGGNFTQVKTRGGAVLDNVSNVAVFDAQTGAYEPGIAPELGAGQTGSKVTDIKAYGSSVVVGGKFSGPATNKRNLVALDGALGVGPGAPQPRWFNSAVLEAVLAAPAVRTGSAATTGTVYGGGASLQAFEFAGGVRPLWTRATTYIDEGRTHALSRGYRDLELDPDGRTIWAACACDHVLAPDGATQNDAKALVKLDADGAHDPSWRLRYPEQVGFQAFGISIAQDGERVYLAAGGGDFLTAYDKAGGGFHRWKRDTSGAAQVVEVVDGRLVVGGHFWEVADQQSDNCGERGPTPDNPKLDPSPGGLCETRHGLAAYSFEGVLDGGGTPENTDDGWNPMLEGKYNLAWALHPGEATAGGATPRLHVGGEFLTVSGTKQNYYARLS